MIMYAYGIRTAQLSMLIFDENSGGVEKKSKSLKHKDKNMDSIIRFCLL